MKKFAKPTKPLSHSGIHVNLKQRATQILCLLKKKRFWWKNDEIAREFSRHFEKSRRWSWLLWISFLPYGKKLWWNRFFNFKILLTILKIKQNFNLTGKLYFKEVSLDEIKKSSEIFHIIRLDGEIPLQILKKSDFSFVELKNCSDYAILHGKLPDCLKLADVTPVHKKEDPTNKSNFRPVSVLPLLSKVSWVITQPAITYLKLTIETLEQGVKYVQS